MAIYELEEARYLSCRKLLQHDDKIRSGSVEKLEKVRYEENPISSLLRTRK